MLDNLFISKENRAQCKVHRKDLVFARRINSFLQTEMPLVTCSECTGVSPSLGGKALFNCDSDYSICSVSFTDLSGHPPVEIARENTPLDFRNSRIEHMLIKKDSPGYLPGSLVYIPERSLLAVCELDGMVYFWSIGEQVALEKTISVAKNIKFAKYFNISETKRYFIVCSNRGLHIFNATREDVILVKIIDLDPSVIDIECLIEEEKLLSVGFESDVGILDLKTMKTMEVLDMDKYNLKTRIHRIIYMKESEKLALEHEKGLSIFDYNQYKKGNSKNLVQHYTIENKTAYGCLYLPQSKRFILRNSFSESVLLDENGLAKLGTFQGGTIFKASTHDTMRLISNQNESQVIGNHSGHNFSYFANSTEAFSYYLSLLKEGGDVEVLSNQWKFAAADRKQGIVLIFRANAIKDLFGNHYEPGLLSIKSAPIILNLQQPSHSPGVKKRKKGVRIMENHFEENKSLRDAIQKRVKTHKEHLKLKKSDGKSLSGKVKTKAKVEKLGKKIKKIQGKTNIEKKVKTAKTKVKTKEVSKSTTLKMVSMKKEGRREEKVWIVLDEEKKQRVRKNSDHAKKDKRGRKSSSVSQERSRSRSGSKSLTRKAK